MVLKCDPETNHTLSGIASRDHSDGVTVWLSLVLASYHIRVAGLLSANSRASESTQDGESSSFTGMARYVYFSSFDAPCCQ